MSFPASAFTYAIRTDCSVRLIGCLERVDLQLGFREQRVVLVLNTMLIRPLLPDELLDQTRYGGLASGVSSTQFATQHVVHLLRIRFAFAGLHRLADQGVEGFFFASFELRHVVWVGGEHFFDDFV
jgi:hypothetical protein